MDLLELTTVANLTDQILCKNVSQVLEEHYPGWAWLIGVDRGMIRIHSNKLSTLYGILLDTRKIDNDYRLIKLMAGEMLERYGMPRGRYNHETYMNRQRLEMTKKGLQVAGDRSKAPIQQVSY